MGIVVTDKGLPPTAFNQPLQMRALPSQEHLRVVDPADRQREAQPIHPAAYEFVVPPVAVAQMRYQAEALARMAADEDAALVAVARGLARCW